MFAAHNVLRDPPFSRLDLISCRNLLIYFDREVHASVLEMFHFALRPGGYLFLGSSESADTAAHLFSVVDKKNRIYRANPVSRAPRVMPNLPLGVVKTAMPIAQALQPGDARPEKRRLSYAQLHQRLAEQHAPPSVLIDDEANIVHLSQEAGRFLRLAGGAPSHQLLDLVQPELRGELRTAVFQAVRSGRSVEARRVKMEREGRNLLVNMIVRPVQEPELGGRFVLVLFDQVEDAVSGEAIAPDGDLRDPVVLQLEEELRRVKEQLQSTIEDAETSTEELKASNEELQSINEELRSTTEELETSKEELQSINEELITVNHELKSKVDETVKVNDDLQNLIASTDIATVFVDRAMSIKRFTPRATRLFNLIPGDIGRSLLDITHRLDYAGLPEDAAEAFQSLRVIEREVAGDDGSWYLARALPYRTTEDRIDGAVLTFIDITSRRRAEQTMRLVTESTRDYAILTFDLEGRITTWNLAAERVFGYTESDAVGRSVAVLFTPEDLNAGVLDEEMRLAHEDGRAEDERWHVRKDGSRLYCSGITTPLYENGRLNGYGKIARDLTGSKRAEHEREMQLRIEAAGRAEAQAANELKDEFLAVMSHELKNPLNLIQLNAELLARVPEARALPVVARAADTIRRAVRSQAQIIDDLLDLSRAKTGKLGLERTPVDWSETIRMIAAAMHDDVRAKPLQLTLELPGEPVIVDADRVRVEQIVWNLLSNAVKFTPPEGRIDVRLAVDGDFARFEVADTGRGMPPEFLPHAFDMFRQAEANGLRRHGGLGIGLGLVKHVAEAHGGRVEVRSEGLDLGTTLTVWLPLHQAGAESPPAVEGPVGRVQGLRALVVDDDRQGAEALRQLLATENVTVSCEYSAAGALAALKQAPVDFVLTDMAMPGQDGFHLIRALRENPATSALPVIALTGLSRPSDARRAESAGFAALLNKPITLELLLQTLHRVLQR
jgi:two-component system CheB/CheR fusion protein